MLHLNNIGYHMLQQYYSYKNTVPYSSCTFADLLNIFNLTYSNVLKIHQTEKKKNSSKTMFKSN